MKTVIVALSALFLVGCATMYGGMEIPEGAVLIGDAGWPCDGKYGVYLHAYDINGDRDEDFTTLGLLGEEWKDTDENGHGPVLVTIRWGGKDNSEAVEIWLTVPDKKPVEITMEDLQKMGHPCELIQYAPPVVT